MDTTAPQPTARHLYDNKNIENELAKNEQFIHAHRGINHPFLLRFAESTTCKLNSIVFSEFYYFIRYLPFYIAGMAMSTRDEKILREIVVNVAEEVGERSKMPHLDIYRDFLEQLGITQEDIRQYQCSEKTRQIDEGVRLLYTQSPIIKSMGAMFALETMSSRMVTLLNEGLKRQNYDAETRLFFEIHIEAEVGHSNGVYNAVGTYLTEPSNTRLFSDGVQSFMTLIEDFWNGVEELCNSDRGR
jgi:pyrroloquinoline quinone (PQQ) biosynthesis protein C